MGGHSSRSGTLILSGVPEEVRTNLATTLGRARFRVIGKEDVGDFAADAIVVWLGTSADVALRLHKLRIRHPGAALIGLMPGSGSETAPLLQAFRAGLADATSVEEMDEDLVAITKIAIERRRLEASANTVSESFTRELGRRARGLRQAYSDMELAYEDTLSALVRALDVREKATAGHSFRVAYYTSWLARCMGVAMDELENIYRGSLLHDIGKIGIPDSILLKPGKLTTEEFEVMKTHTDVGRGFLKDVSYLSAAIDIPWCHHEKWNGHGYPRGISGKDIPRAARIFAVCDVYDALRSKRCYKEAMPHEESSRIINEQSGEHFDPDIVAAFNEQDTAIWVALDAASRASDSSFANMLEVFEKIDRVLVSIPVSVGEEFPS